MRRYALFIGMEFYPAGGWKDWRGWYDDPEKAAAVGRAAMDRYTNDWWQVVDLWAGMVITEGIAND